MAKNFKKGDKVRVLDARKIGFGSSYWEDGEITTVVDVNSEGEPYLSRGGSDQSGLIILSHELRYIEMYEAMPTKNQRIAELEARVAELEAKFAALKEAL